MVLNPLLIRCLKILSPLYILSRNSDECPTFDRGGEAIVYDEPADLPVGVYFLVFAVCLGVDRYRFMCCLV